MVTKKPRPLPLWSFKCFSIHYNTMNTFAQKQIFAQRKLAGTRNVPRLPRSNQNRSRAGAPVKKRVPAANALNAVLPLLSAPAASVGATEGWAMLAIISAGACVNFGRRLYKARKEVPGIPGPSKLVPLGPKTRVEDKNPFREEGVDDDEFRRVTTEVGKRKAEREERYYIRPALGEVPGIVLVPNDFKYKMNRNTPPLLASLGAAMVFAALAMNSCMEGREAEKRAAVQQQADAGQERF